MSRGNQRDTGELACAPAARSWLPAQQHPLQDSPGAAPAAAQARTALQAPQSPPAVVHAAAASVQQAEPNAPSAALPLPSTHPADRARAQKRKDAAGKPAKDKDGLSAQQRKERDAKALQEKAAKKAAAGGQSQ